MPYQVYDFQTFYPVSWIMFLTFLVTFFKAQFFFFFFFLEGSVKLGFQPAELWAETQAFWSVTDVWEPSFLLISSRVYYEVIGDSIRPCDV